MFDLVFLYKETMLVNLLAVWALTIFLVIFWSLITKMMIDYTQKKHYIYYEMILKSFSNPFAILVLILVSLKTMEYVYMVYYVNLIGKTSLTYTGSTFLEYVELVDALPHKQTSPTIFSSLETLSIVSYVLYCYTRFTAIFEKKIFEQHSKFKMDDLAIKGLIKTSLVVLYFSMLLLVSENIFGVSTSSILALGGIGGIAIGLASKEIISNIFGGLLIFVERPFAIGDMVSLPSQDLDGIVIDIGWRVTVVRSYDKTINYVPNSLFNSSVMINLSRRKHRRIRFYFGLHFNDASKVLTVAKQIETYINTSEAYASQDQETYISGSLLSFVRLNKFADSSLKLDCQAFTKNNNWDEYMKAREALLIKIKEIADTNQCTIPFNTITIVDDK